MQIIEIIKFPDKILAVGCIRLIRVYQKLISPDHSAMGKGLPFCGCRYYPSCSEYGVQSLQTHGFVFGLPRLIWRILRCNPFSSGGMDPVLSGNENNENNEGIK